MLPATQVMSGRALAVVRVELQFAVGQEMWIGLIACQILAQKLG
jgi:hypothetical protein